jgi:acetoin utilization deacetylase AcuC-like enzyme
MQIVHHPDSVRHDPARYFRCGSLIVHPEQAARYILLRDAARDAGHDLVRASNVGSASILAVHEAGYVAFLREAWERRGELSEVGDEILTGHFARPQMHRRPEGMLGLIGLYTADTEAALAQGHAYALCRPPGHHAYANSAGGFCYLNNTAIAGEHMRRATGGPVAIIDIDVHHGNGTQGIFYARDDVLTVSVHADPANYFPFFAGYADEIGTGEGTGFNRNIPVAHGAGDAPWLAAIHEALAAVARHRPAALVVALGLDASQDDPIGVLKVTREGFAAAAEAIAGSGLPTAIVQEGGYLCEALPRNLVAFLEAFDAVRA